MKRIFFTLALISITFAASFAQHGSSKTENDAAMQTGRTAFISKEAKLESDIKSHNYTSAETVVADMISLMRRAMQQTQNQINMQQGAEQMATSKHYNELESTVHQFHLDAQDVKGNGVQLIKDAKAFIAKY